MIAGENWLAVTKDEATEILPGDQLLVREVQDLCLVVEKQI